MLDFYIIEDIHAKPSDPGHMNLTFVGSLDEKVFHNLSVKGIIDDRFDYYSDFRWGTETLLQIRETIRRKKMDSDTDVQKIIILLNAVESPGYGLIAYGD